LKRVCIYMIVCLLTTPIQVEAADHYIERTGDLLQVAVPLTGYAMTYGYDDEEGRLQFYKSFITVTGVTYALKFTIDKERPNGKGAQSFPSGHTSAAFSGASFIQKRYGWKYGTPAYLAASFVGWSRIDANRHYLEDVLAGAAIGIMSSYYFTTPFDHISLSLFSSGSSYGIAIRGRW